MNRSLSRGPNKTWWRQHGIEMRLNYKVNRDRSEQLYITMIPNFDLTKADSRLNILIIVTSVRYCMLADELEVENFRRQS